MIMANPQWNLTYEQFVNTCIDYYGSQEAYSQALANGISSKDYANIFLKAGYTVEQNLNGDITYVGPNENTPAVVETLPSTINSNSQTGYSGGGASWSEPVGSTGDGTPTGNVSSTTKDGQPTVRKYTNGELDTSGIGKIIGAAGKVIGALMAYNQGLNLGKRIDKALYDADPEYWDEKGMSSLDPSTWGDIASSIDSPVGRFAFNLLADVRPSEGGAPTTTLYTQDLAQAYFTKWLESVGFLNNPVTDIKSSENVLSSDDVKSISTGNGIQVGGTGTLYTDTENTIGYDVTNGVLGGALEFTITPTSSGNSYGYSVRWIESSDTPNSKLKAYITINNQTAYYSVGEVHGGYDGGNPPEIVPDSFNYSDTNASNIPKIAWSMVYSRGESEGQAGVSDQSGATVFNFDEYNLNKDSSVDEILEALKKFNPDAYNNRIEIDIAQPDGSTKTFTYWPTSTVNGVDEKGNPITETKTYTDPATGEQTEVVPQAQTQINTENSTDTQLATLLKLLTQTLTQTGEPSPDPTGVVNPETQTKTDPETGTTTVAINLPPNLPPTGTGDTPTVVMPTGHASSLWAIYNPTLEQINSFGSWLWSSDFIDQILKLFSDPMQAIIGIHKIYCTPIVGETRTIKVGYLDSGVSSKIVTEQYTTVDCGSINLFEYFGNVFDYAPYTQLRLYLPFIGIVNLDTADAMRGVIHVVYHVDVLSGACLAEVKITRDAAGGTLYQFAGNAAVTMPISSGSYIGVIANVVGVASSAIGGFASGGVAGGIAGGVTGALTRRGGTQVEHSGNFSGNAGAMGIKKPYLIIERPQTALADNYAEYIGNPSNQTVVLSSCTGYIKVKEVHLENVPATGAELSEIEQNLKQGVII